MDTRVFFVTDSLEDNEELFETFEGALAYVRANMPSLVDPRIRVCFVQNAYRQGEGWNYDDKANTFETIKEIEL